MKSIAFIVPYFGKFNNYFRYWLKSCKNNPTIDWIIFTDCAGDYSFPSNVKVHKITFDSLRDLIQSKFDFQINLQKPYKLCDYKPSYGYIFQKYLTNYDFWGFCDVDLIWGNIRNYITDDVLQSYDKISTFGHCTLIRNNPTMNELFKTKVHSLPNYKEAYTSELAYLFDEVGMNFIAKAKKIECYNLSPYFYDCSYKKSFYKPVKSQKKYYPNNAFYMFSYEKGKLYSIFNKNKDLKQRELLYVHLQKRKIKVEKEEASDIFCIYNDNLSISMTKPKTFAELKKTAPKKLIYWPYIKNRFHKIRVKIFHAKGLNYYTYPIKIDL